MFDVFYHGEKPNIFAFELPAKNLKEAASLSRTKFFWFINGSNDYTNFDFEWRSPPWEEGHVHCFPSQWQRTSGTYFANKWCVENPKWHFRTEQQVQRKPSLLNWTIPDWIDPSSVDTSWHPDDIEPECEYHFASQWQSASGVTYGKSTEKKFVDSFQVKALPNTKQWTIPENIEKNSIDFSWHPNPMDPPYIYHFPSQWQSASGVIYTVEGATGIKIVDSFYVQSLPTVNNWIIPEWIDPSSVETTWHPNPLDPPYHYHFPSQWQTHSGVVYSTEDATDVREEDAFEVIAIDHDGWIVPDSVDFETVQRSWHPDVLDPPYHYHFPSRYQSSSGVVYSMVGATSDKFSDAFVVETLEDTGGRWIVPKNIDRSTVDFRWHPNPLDPPYNYHFPSQWQPTSGVVYCCEGATEIKLVDDFQVNALPTKENWEIAEDIDESKIDFSWHPNFIDPPFIYHFPSEWQESSGLIYKHPHGTKIRLEETAPTRSKQVTKPLTIFFVDKMNSQSSKRYEELKERYPNIQRIRYANSEMATIKRCCERSETQRFWVISSENLYEHFDFTWQPATWQRHMTHVFGSQWEKYSSTYQINRWEFERHIKWAKSIQEFPNLNFVNDQFIDVPVDRCEYYWLDWGNATDGFEKLSERLPKLKRTRVVGDYLSALKRIAEIAKTEWVWITSSVCDYTKFDFTWTPEPWQSEMLHCFPSSEQKQGDTFYMPVQVFKKQMDKLEILDWFETINYCEDQNAPRLDAPIVKTNDDDLSEVVKEYSFNFPYAVFTTDQEIQHALPLWREKDRVVQPFTKSHSVSIVPKDAKTYINKQIYDYPYLSTVNLKSFEDKPLDIVFISNGEPDEAKWYRHTSIVSNRDVKWVRGINGREAAYKAAALESETPWFFAVFAKLEVLSDFDFNWQPDRWQGRKHWIFYSKNPLNGLEYGHQGLIVYNKELVLNTKEIVGLDYTLSAPHGVVPKLSGIAHYNQTPWMTWRTAFREVVKLKHYQKIQPSVETDYRLDIWLSVAIGQNAEWSIQGAKDAVEYYEQINGEYKFLLDTFDWKWLRWYAKGYNFAE